MRRAYLAAIAGAGAGLSAHAGTETLLLSLVPSETAITVGQFITVDLFAEVNSGANEGLVAWGVDLAGPASMEITAIELAQGWGALPSFDGDMLAAFLTDPVQFPEGLLGSGVLATLEIRFLNEGVFDLALGYTPGDPTEGFSRFGGGLFGNPQLGGARITVSNGAPVIPSPLGAALAGAGLLALGTPRRRRCPAPVAVLNNKAH